MIIPDKINIAGHEIKVEMKEFLKDDENKDLMGYAYLIEDRIELAKTCNGGVMSMDNVSQIFLHEIIHQVCDKFEIDMNEDQVTTLASGLYHTIKDNLLCFYER
jgi:hypothetical protein